MNRSKRLIVGLGLALVGAPCASQNTRISDQLSDLGIKTRQVDRGVLVFIPDVLFAFDEDTLSAAGTSKLTDVADVIERLADGRQIAIEGHTDSVGSEPYNLDLSRRRAKSVAASLARGGVDRERLQTEGLGSSRPVAPNRRADGRDNPAGRALNRRVEIVILNP